MHCIDCHFYQDGHGNTKLYGEVRAAIEIQCIDCHGTASESLIDKVDVQWASGEPLQLPTSGPAAPTEGNNLLGPSYARSANLASKLSASQGSRQS